MEVAGSIRSLQEIRQILRDVWVRVEAVDVFENLSATFSVVTMYDRWNWRPVYGRAATNSCRVSVGFRSSYAAMQCLAWYSQFDRFADGRPFTRIIRRIVSMLMWCSMFSAGIRSDKRGFSGTSSDALGVGYVHAAMCEHK